MKLHLGAGYKRFDGYLNVDFDPLCEPDYNFDLEGPWPLDDNSVTAVIAHHVFEHLGDPGYFNFLKELYRVCAPNTVIDVVVPHHRHDCFLNDPTHRRPITIEGMRLFSKAHNKFCIEVNDGSSRLGLFYNVDFEIIDFKFNIDPMYDSVLETMTEGSKEEAEFQVALRERNNMIVDVNITLLVIKDE
jgi:predicted SAM-dependent methyltransferase